MLVEGMQLTSAVSAEKRMVILRLGLLTQVGGGQKLLPLTYLLLLGEAWHSHRCKQKNMHRSNRTWSLGKVDMGEPKGSSDHCTAFGTMKVL